MALVERVLWQIEMRLDQPVSLEDLAVASAVSPFHLSRSFRSATGLAPMTYLRARRLSVAARRLAAGRQDILQVALDAQYTSHEAFTRAFAGYFGLLPSSVRDARSITGLQMMEPIKMKKDMIVDVPAPRIEERAGFSVVGMGMDCTFEDVAQIPQVWGRFAARAEEIEEPVAGVGYGLCCPGDERGHFRYVAGIESKASAVVPEGMEAVAVPNAKYAVFTHSGHISDLPKTVYTIWNKTMPEAGLSPSGGVELEIYDQRFDAQTGRGSVEIWIPVE